MCLPGKTTPGQLGCRKTIETADQIRAVIGCKSVNCRARARLRANFPPTLLRCYRSAWRPTQASEGARYSAVQQVKQEVRVVVEKASRNTRRLYAAVDIGAPREVVWQALTDYDGLGNFIPGLAENRCLERRPQGAQLLQVGQQDLALGAKFRATVLLDIQEFPAGVPATICSASGSSSKPASGSDGSQAALFPEPRSESADGSPQDIAFGMIKGDFAAFRGIWRMQERSPGVTRLNYSLHVQPQPWLPVRFIQGRIEGEIKLNLSAVRDYSEQQWRGQQQG